MIKVDYQELEHGITVIDTKLMGDGVTCSYLVEQNGKALFIEVGPSNATPILLEVLSKKNISPEQVEYVIVTHIHLDHAGGAGSMMQNLPHAKFVVHPRGFRHMKDPSKLIAGATAVYGAEKLKEIFGDILPIPEERIIQCNDGFQIDFYGRKFTFLDTRGHAKHHCCIYDEQSQGMFTGDSFGLSYRKLDIGEEHFIFPTTTPIQFEPEEAHKTINRVVEYKPKYLYLTHFGRIDAKEYFAKDLHCLLDDFVAIADKYAYKPNNRFEKIKEDVNDVLKRSVRLKGSKLSDNELDTILAMDVELNAQGLDFWLNKK